MNSQTLARLGIWGWITQRPENRPLQREERENKKYDSVGESVRVFYFALRYSLFALRSSLFALHSSLFALLSQQKCFSFFALSSLAFQDSSQVCICVSRFTLLIRKNLVGACLQAVSIPNTNPTQIQSTPNPHQANTQHTISRLEQNKLTVAATSLASVCREFK